MRNNYREPEVTLWEKVSGILTDIMLVAISVIILVGGIKALLVSVFN